MTSAPLGRRDKQALLDFDNSVRDFCRQFGDQQRILDVRTENKVALITDLQEFFKRRSELDLEYGKNLDRLCERFTERVQKQRATYGLQKKDRASFVNLWSKLLIDAKFKAKTATTLSDIYSKNIVHRLVEITEDIQRIGKSVKETHLILQQVITEEITQLQNSMKTYYTKLNDFVVSKSKFRVSEDNIKKAEESPMKKGNEKRLKQLEKNMDKHRVRLLDCQVKAINGRNAYILNVESVSSALSKYYNHDVSDIVMKYDHNFHNSFSSMLQSFIGADIRMANAQIQSAHSLAHTVAIMDAENDNKMFLEDNQAAFLPMMKFSLVLHSEDEVQTITADENIVAELNAQQRELHNTIKSLQVELSDLQVQMEKRRGGLNATYKKYDSEMNGFYHIDMMPVSGAEKPTPSTLLANPPQQLKVDKEEWETGLLTKFKEKIMIERVQAQTQAKYDALTKALGEIALDSTRHNAFITNSGKRTVKLFGTSLKQQLDETGRDIPDIVESCAKYIARFGLRHQGIFRVPGASQEISDMKVAFEDGRDPLSGLNHWKDINAVAGVFRAYLRESEESLFPFIYNQDYLRATSITKLDEQIAEAKSILNKIPEWNLQLIKYMLKFLNLIAQYSEQNKMTSHNLAVVFGPTLFRVADNENLLTKQGQINVFIDLLIREFYQIFPDEPREGDFDEADGVNSDEGDIEHNEEHTEDELSDEDPDETTEAIALHDFIARSAKEISFNKGDKIKIFTKTTNDWWDARVNGKYGYVPVSYIKLFESSRPVSISEGENENKSEKMKSQDKDELSFPLPDKKFLYPEGEYSPPAINTPDAEKNTSDLPLKTFGDTEVDLCSNVFATIDPTCATSPNMMRRIGSERYPSSVKSNPPIRTHSDKREIGPRVQKLPMRKPNVNETDSATEELQSTLSAVSSAFAAGKTTGIPPLGGKPMFLVSQQDLQANKLRSPSETEDRSHPSSPVFPPELAVTGRPSLKDKSRAFSLPVMDRPISAVVRPILGHMQIEPADRPSPVPNFKPPPPPPALKPKPSSRKKDGPIHPSASGSTMVKNKNNGKDITHL